MLEAMLVCSMALATTQPAPTDWREPQERPADRYNETGQLAPVANEAAAQRVLAQLQQANDEGRYQRALSAWKTYQDRMAEIRRDLIKSIANVDRSDLEELEAWKSRESAALQPVTDEKLARFAEIHAEFNAKRAASPVLAELALINRSAQDKAGQALRVLSDAWARETDPMGADGLRRAVRLFTLRSLRTPRPGSRPPLDAVLSALADAECGGPILEALAPESLDPDLGLWRLEGEPGKIVEASEIEQEAAAWELISARSADTKDDLRLVEPGYQDLAGQRTDERVARTSRRVTAARTRPILAIGSWLAESVEPEDQGNAARRCWLGLFAKMSAPQFAGNQWMEGDGGELASSLAAQSGSGEIEAEVAALLASYRTAVAESRAALAEKFVKFSELLVEWGLDDKRTRDARMDCERAVWPLQEGTRDRLRDALGGALGARFVQAYHEAAEARPALFGLRERRAPPPHLLAP